MRADLPIDLRPILILELAHCLGSGVGEQPILALLLAQQRPDGQQDLPRAALAGGRSPHRTAIDLQKITLAC